MASPRSLRILAILGGILLSFYRAFIDQDWKAGPNLGGSRPSMYDDNDAAFKTLVYSLQVPGAPLFVKVGSVPETTECPRMQ